MHYYLEPPSPYRLRITIAGCGGTGSFLAESVCRLLIGTPHQLTLIDPDTVEPRNILRQNFYPQDAGLNKAAALANRLSRNFNVPITYSELALVSPNHGLSYLNNPLQEATVILTCVDNPKARQAVQDLTSSHRNPWVIDAGNDSQFGQILIGNTDKMPAEGLAFQESTCRRLPMPGLQRPDLLQNQNAPPADRDRDCARAIELREQSPTINQMMATLTADTLLKLLTGTCRYMALYVDLETSAIRPVPANPENVRKVTDIPA